MESLKQQIITELKRMKVPGAIVSIHSKHYGDLNVFYGYSNLEKQIKMCDSYELPWKIGSITKTFTGTMILQMLDEGKLKLDEPVNKHFLGIPNGDNITIRELGNMRSGIFNYSQSELFQEVNDPHPYRVWEPAELLAIGITQPPYFAPNEGFHYSNTNTVILGMIVERLNPTCDGESSNYKHELKKRMLEPLQLHDTALPAIITEPCIHGYLPLEDGSFEDVTKFNETWTWSAGQMTSTLSDMHRYARLSIAQHITISNYAARQQRKWATFNTIEGVDLGYGFNLEKVNDYIGHNGTLPGYSCYITANPLTRTTIVVMCNIQNSLEEDVTPADYIMERVIIPQLP